MSSIEFLYKGNWSKWPLYSPARSRSRRQNFQAMRSATFRLRSTTSACPWSTQYSGKKQRWPRSQKKRSRVVLQLLVMRVGRGSRRWVASLKPVQLNTNGSSNAVQWKEVSVKIFVQSLTLLMIKLKKTCMRTVSRIQPAMQLA